MRGGIFFSNGTHLHVFELGQFGLANRGFKYYKGRQFSMVMTRAIGRSRTLVNNLSTYIRFLAT